MIKKTKLVQTAILTSLKGQLFKVVKKRLLYINKVVPGSGNAKKIIRLNKVKSRGKLLNRLITTRLDNPPRLIKDIHELRIACIMDEFTYHCFKHEVKLTQLTPIDGKRELVHLKPDAVFIESAWYGVAKSWGAKVRNCSVELLEIIKYCREHQIITLLWNKEDPVHFSKFLNLAKIVDYVFTTDIDCIPKYKYYLGHERVYLLPFAAQVNYHNPIEIYERKDAFNFAGSYNHRYPERQKDFSVLIDTVKQYQPVEIYDRFFNSIHPYFVFPEKYASMILGRLPFNEIDRAYKGYRYAINMNSVKQSQTMFARRVFELLASNTLVVSNFSRGVRAFFGDLVISTDIRTELNRRLVRLNNDDLYYRKLRLHGLRKVMLEHTYSHRLSYIHSILSNCPYEYSLPKTALVSAVKTMREMDRILTQFKNFTYKEKSLYLVTSNLKIKQSQNKSIRIFKTISDCMDAIRNDIPRIDLIGQLIAGDYYGPSYLTDLALAATYSDTKVFSKLTHYTTHHDSCVLIEKTKPYNYSFVTTLSRMSLARMRHVTLENLVNWLSNPLGGELKQTKVLAIDEFNYCRDGELLNEDILQPTVDDIPYLNNGLSFENDFSHLAESLVSKSDSSIYEQGSFLEIDALELEQLFYLSSHKPITYHCENEILQITSTLEPHYHTYIYTYAIPKEEFNLAHDTVYKLEAESSCGLKTVFEFQDEHHKKIGHVLHNSGKQNDIAIPKKCKFIRFGFRLFGPGIAKIYRLQIGLYPLLSKATVLVGNSPHLMLTKIYPSYMKPHHHAFLHKQVCTYINSGFSLDVFCFKINGSTQLYREYQGVDIAMGNPQLLNATLNTGRYKSVLVHGLDEKMWELLEIHLHNIQVTLLLYGNDLQDKTMGEEQRLFWRTLLTERRENLKIKFISHPIAYKMANRLAIDPLQIQYEIMELIG